MRSEWSSPNRQLPWPLPSGSLLHIDLAVVDINLKGEMSYDLIDRLRDRGVRVVVVSGYAASESMSAAAVLQKPLSIVELIATLRQVMQAA